MINGMTIEKVSCSKFLGLWIIANTRIKSTKGNDDMFSVTEDANKHGFNTPTMTFGLKKTF